VISFKSIPNPPSSSPSSSQTRKGVILPWTEDDDQKLIEGIKNIGCNYQKLQKMMKEMILLYSKKDSKNILEKKPFLIR